MLLLLVLPVIILLMLPLLAPVSPALSGIICLGMLAAPGGSRALRQLLLLMIIRVVTT
jgi:hypothetical protein